MVIVYHASTCDSQVPANCYCFPCLTTCSQLMITPLFRRKNIARIAKLPYCQGRVLLKVSLYCLSVIVQVVCLSVIVQVVCNVCIVFCVMLYFSRIAHKKLCQRQHCIALSPWSLTLHCFKPTCIYFKLKCLTLICLVSDNTEMTKWKPESIKSFSLSNDRTNCEHAYCTTPYSSK